jgi:hypothetical protein
MKGFIHIESTGREGALRCEANLSDVSKVDRYQALDAACRLLKLDNRDLAIFFAVRSAGAFDQCTVQSDGAGVALGDVNELLCQYQEMKKEDNENGNGEEM